MENAFMFAALIPPRPEWDEILIFSALGFSVVMIILLMISFVMGGVGRLFVLAESVRKSAAEKKAAKAAEAAAKAQSSIPEAHAFAISAAVAEVFPELGSGSELVAVIAAAASAVLDDEVRVVSVKPVDMAYAREGRMELFASKRIVPEKVK